MNVTINSEQHELSSFADRVLRRKVGAVLNRLSRYGEHSPVEFKISSQEHEILVEAKVDIGGQRLQAAKKSPHEVDAVNGCISALLRQFDKVRLQKLPALRKKARSRTAKRNRVADAAPVRLAKIPSQIIEELYPSLRRMATEKVALYQATSGIEPGYLDPDEVVDDVLVAMIGTLDPESSAMEVKKRFFRATEALIKARIRDYEVDSDNLVSTDGEVIEADDKIELSSLGDEILDFWVLDEQLFLEDVMEAPDLRSPEDIVADKEARHVLLNALLRLPSRSRYVFTSYVMDENSIDDVAAFVGEDVEKTEHLLRSATQELRSYLTESSTMISGESVVVLYRRMSEMFHADPVSISKLGPVSHDQKSLASTSVLH